MNELSKRLAQHRGKGYVIAPAGFGKTHLIAEAVKVGVRRSLILTHTYAGVNALKDKLRILGVKTTKYQVDTIASWALRFCLSYPKNSGWSIERPNGEQWSQLYYTSTSFLAKEFVQRIIHASYDGVYVDEYQDCSVLQHAMVTKLAEILPCCILGDPLQGIFDFADIPVDWDKDIYPNFRKIGELTTPWRWHNSGAHEIGDWLKDVRQKMECDEPISAFPHPNGMTVHLTSSEDSLSRKQFNTCRYFSLKNGEKAVAIHKGEAIYKNKSHKLAMQLSGKFSSIEEIEGTDLFRFVNKISKNKTPAARLMTAIDFAAKCMTRVKAALAAGTKRGEQITITKRTKNPDLGVVANAYLDDTSSDRLKSFFTLLKRTPGIRPFRRDLLNRAMQVLTIHSRSPSLSLEEAANIYQKIFRHSGRPISYPKLIGTTLLVKGLEFDHTIVLDAASLSKKELYVALTRGSRTITIISSSPTLPSGCLPKKP